MAGAPQVQRLQGQGPPKFSPWQGRGPSSSELARTGVFQVQSMQGQGPIDTQRAKKATKGEKDPKDTQRAKNGEKGQKRPKRHPKGEKRRKTVLSNVSPDPLKGAGFIKC